MVTWFKLLSRRQIIWGAGGLLVAAALILTGLALQDDGEGPDPAIFTTKMSIKDAAMALGSTGKAVARELGLPLDAPKGAPLESLGVTTEQLDQTIHHLLGHRDSTLKYWLYAALSVWGFIFLTRIGRPDGAGKKGKRKIWYPRRIYTVALLVSVVGAGFLLGKSPNPMEGAVKVFKTMAGLYPDPLAKVLAFLFFLGLFISNPDS